MVTIKNLRKVVSEYKHVPEGCHVEIWGTRNGDVVELWTSEYLTRGSWTEYKNEPSYINLDCTMAVVMWEADRCGEKLSTTAMIEKAVRRLWRD